MDQHCVDWDSIPEQTAPSGVAKQVLAGIGASLVRVRVPAGTTANRHSHPHEQFVQVLSGSGVLETKQGMQSFGSGSVFHFPADTWHAARFDT